MALTNDDITRIEFALKGIISTEVSPRIDALEKKIKILPTKNEFLDSMSKLMGEVKDMRDEHTILDGRTAEHTHQIEKLEKIHPHGQHSIA